MGKGVRALFSWIGQHRWLALLVGVSSCAVGLAVGINLWASHHFRAAQRALAEDHLVEARRHVEHCLRVWSRSPRAHLLAARIRRFGGAYAEAEAHLRECERLQKEATVTTQLEWVLLRAQQGEVDEVALGLWTCIRANDPQACLILRTLAHTYLRDLRFHLARFCLDEWLRREPDSVVALDWRGWVLERLHDPRKASTDYQRVVELRPNRTTVRVRLVGVLLESATPLDALSHAEHMARHHPEDPAILLLLARCRVLQGQHPVARDLLQRVLASEPDNPSALLQRGQLELELNQPAQAERYLRRAARKSPNDPLILYSLARSLHRQGNRKAEASRCLAHFEKVKKGRQRLDELLTRQGQRVPHDADLAHEAGTLLLQMHQEGPALRLFYTALNVNPDHQPTHRTLLRYYKKIGDARKATQHRARLVKPAGAAHSSVGKDR
jgi:predicted Zn-dependent protease